MKIIQKGLIKKPFEIPYKWISSYLCCDVAKYIKPIPIVHNQQRFLVPITRDNTSLKVLIYASSSYGAMMIACENFTKDGWEVDGEYEYYEQV